jgi:alpha-galactosidase
MEDKMTDMRDDILRNEAIAMKLFHDQHVPPFSFQYGGRKPADIDWERKLEGDYVDLTKWQRTIDLYDPETCLRVRAVCTIYADTPGFEWVIHFMNQGPDDTPILEAVDALKVRQPVSAVLVSRLWGSSCAQDDWLPFDTVLSPGEALRFGPSGGRSSGGACPFFNTSWIGRYGAGGVITAIGWSGHWQAVVRYGHDHRLEISAGMQGLRTILRPGEAIRSPRILQVWWQGDIDESYNLFRRTMFAHVLPRRESQDGGLIYPPVADLCTSAKIDNAPNQAFVLSHVEAIKDRPVEVYWIDAYQHRGGFPDGMGNYNVEDIGLMTSARRFPDGLGSISDAIHDAGMGFLLWQEPERVAPGTFLDREHPEWVLRAEGQKWGLLNLADLDARRYITKYLLNVIEELGLDWLRIDFNLDPLPYWEQTDEPGRRGMTEVRYIEGLYAMLDEIRTEYPRVKLDNCASGGRRIDLETCSRMTPLWRSDLPGSLFVTNQWLEAAMLNQAMTAGLSRYVPFSMGGGAASTPYLFRSAYNGGIPLMEEFRVPGFPVENVDKGIEEAKRLRKYLVGDFYVLNEVTVDPTQWLVMQWHLPDEDAGMVLAFRRHKSPYMTFECKFRGIDPLANYLMQVCPNHTRSEAIRTTGARMSNWLDIEKRPGSLLIEYRKEA